MKNNDKKQRKEERRCDAAQRHNSSNTSRLCEADLYGWQNTARMQNAPKQVDWMSSMSVLLGGWRGGSFITIKSPVCNVAFLSCPGITNHTSRELTCHLDKINLIMLIGKYMKTVRVCAVTKVFKYCSFLCEWSAEVFSSTASCGWH